ncbi:MAG: hydantoinase B/oxoprolinase family protein [Thermoleophilaceae bacterium]
MQRRSAADGGPTVGQALARTEILLGFSASRAHHADVGAPEPGSMPADSRTLDDEGVVISPTRLARGGELDRDLLAQLTSKMRDPGQREADLRAQLAANRSGAERLVALAERHGVDTLRQAMEETLDYAERRTRARIEEIERRRAHRHRRAGGPRGRPDAPAAGRPSGATSWSSTSPARRTSTRET